MASPSSSGNIYGRDAELSTLKNYIQHAESGKGGIVFLRGEAGIGKTALLKKTAEYAEEHGFQVIKGWCLPDTLDPLLPVREALADGGLEHLYTGENPPRIEGLYLLSPGGLPIAKAERPGISFDSDVLASMLGAVIEFLKDSMELMQLDEEGEGIKSMSYGQYRIIIENLKGLNLAAIVTGQENEFLLGDLMSLLENIQDRVGERIKEWEGDTSEVREAENMLKAFLSSGHYDGVNYGTYDPRVRQSHLFENILLGLRRYSSRKPVLLILDDLQWADSTTLSLIHYLGRNREHMRLLILGAYRPEDLLGPNRTSPPLSDSLRLMNREGLYREIEVPRLSRTHVLAMIREELPGISDDDLSILMKKIYDSTEGNPFFVKEILTLMKERQTLKTDGNSWHISPESRHIEIPPRIYDVMIGRIERLGEEEREVLEKAAILGLEFRLEDLACLCSSDLSDIAGLVWKIEKNSGAIVEKKENYRFDQSMLREMVYNGIPPVIRKAYHRSAARCLMESGGERAGEIGTHFHMAGDPAGVEYLMRAGEDAEKTYSNTEAIQYYEMAYSLSRGSDERAEIVEKLGDLYSLTGSSRRAVQIYTEALSLKKNDTPRSIAIITKMASVLDKLGKYDEALDWIEKGEEMAARARENVSRELGSLLLSRGNISMRLGELKKAEELFRKALLTYRENNHEADIPNAYMALAIAVKALGRYDEALNYLEESRKRFEEMEELTSLARIYNTIGSVYSEMGEMEEALKYHRMALSMSEKTGNIWSISASYNNIGLIFAMGDDPSMAVHYYEKALRLANRIGELRGAALLYNNLGGLHYDMGRLEESLEHYEKALDICRTIGARWEEAMVMNNIGEVYRAMGLLEEGEKYHLAGTEACEKMGEKMLALFHSCGLADIMIERGLKEKDRRGIEEGIRISEDACGVAREMDIKDAEALALRIAGKGFLFLNDPEGVRKAAEYLGKSLELFEEMGRSTDIAITLLLLSGVTEDASQREGIIGRAESILRKRKGERWLEIFRGRAGNGC